MDAVLDGRPHESGNPLRCLSTQSATPDVYVRNVAGQTVAGPVVATGSTPSGDYSSTSTIQVTGRLRLDVESHCSSFSVRIDGVQTTSGLSVAASPDRAPGERAEQILDLVDLVERRVKQRAQC